MTKRILAVDDDVVMLSFVSEVLTANGYDVICATGGEEAIRIMGEQSFDGVLLDFFMPDKDGLDVICAMYGKRKHTPTIIITTGLSDYYTASVQGFGITREILKKPVTAEQLLEAVARLLEVK